jgi:hypothetical protein
MVYVYTYINITSQVFKNSELFCSYYLTLFSLILVTCTGMLQHDFLHVHVIFLLSSKIQINLLVSNLLILFTSRSPANSKNHSLHCTFILLAFLRAGFHSYRNVSSLLATNCQHVCSYDVQSCLLGYTAVKWWWRQYAPPKRRSTITLHAAVRTWNLTCMQLTSCWKPNAISTSV